MDFLRWVSQGISSPTALEDFWNHPRLPASSWAGQPMPRLGWRTVLVPYPAQKVRMTKLIRNSALSGPRKVTAVLHAMTFAGSFVFWRKEDIPASAPSMRRDTPHQGVAHLWRVALCMPSSLSLHLSWVNPNKINQVTESQGNKGREKHPAECLQHPSLC